MKFILLASYAVTVHDDMDCNEDLKNLGTFDTIFQAAQAAKEDIVENAENLAYDWCDASPEYETLPLEEYRNLKTEDEFTSRVVDYIGGYEFNAYLERLEHESEIKKFSIYTIGERWYDSEGWYSQDNYYIMRVE